MIKNINKKGDKFQNLAMVIIQDRCIGCDACYVSCKTDWEVPAFKEAYRTKVWNVEDTDANGNPTINFLPVLCNHCDNPPCVHVCPTGASFKRQEDGIVLVDSDMCIGCKACMIACPYDARYYDEQRQTVDKCTFCLPRLNEGLEPACVNTCVGGSRNFGDISDEQSSVAKLLKNAISVSRLKESDGTLPNVYYITINE